MFLFVWFFFPTRHFIFLALAMSLTWDSSTDTDLLGGQCQTLQKFSRHA